MTSPSPKAIRSKALRSVTRVATADDICLRMDCYARILGTFSHDLYYLISKAVENDLRHARWIRRGQYRLWIFAEFAIEFGVVNEIAVIGRVHGSAVPRGNAIYEHEQSGLPENERGSYLIEVDRDSP